MIDRSWSASWLSVDFQTKSIGVSDHNLYDIPAPGAPINRLILHSRVVQRGLMMPCAKCRLRVLHEADCSRAHENRPVAEALHDRWDYGDSVEVTPVGDLPPGISPWKQPRSAISPGISLRRCPRSRPARGDFRPAWGY